MLGGKSSGHHVAVESQELQKVGHPRNCEEPFDNRSSELIPKHQEKTSENQVEYCDENQDVDVDGDKPGLGFVNGKQSFDGEKEEKKSQHNCTNQQTSVE